MITLKNSKKPPFLRQENLSMKVARQGNISSPGRRLQTESKRKESGKGNLQRFGKVRLETADHAGQNYPNNNG